MHSAESKTNKIERAVFSSTYDASRNIVSNVVWSSTLRVCDNPTARTLRQLRTQLLHHMIKQVNAIAGI